MTAERDALAELVAAWDANAAATGAHIHAAQRRYTSAWAAARVALAAPAPPVAQPAEPPATDDLHVKQTDELRKDAACLRALARNDLVSGAPLAVLVIHHAANDADEAADLIERQAREIAELQANFDGLDAASTDERRKTHIWRQRAERYEAERDALIHDIERAQDTNAGLLAECEQLRAAIREHNDGLQQMCDAQAATGRCDAWRSRGKSCVDCPRDFVVDAARAKVKP